MWVVRKERALETSFGFKALFFRKQASSCMCSFSILLSSIPPITIVSLQIQLQCFRRAPLILLIPEETRSAVVFFHLSLMMAPLFLMWSFISLFTTSNSSRLHLHAILQLPLRNWIKNNPALAIHNFSPGAPFSFPRRLHEFSTGK